MDRDSPSWEQWRAYERSGQTAKANLVWKIAREPRALWLGRFTRPNFHVKVHRLIDAAAAEGAVPLVDAYLWINRPGYVQSCQHRPIAWYPPRALEYARWATDWEHPPKGTRFGHFKHYSLRQLGVRR